MSAAPLAAVLDGAPAVEAEAMGEEPPASPEAAPAPAPARTHAPTRPPILSDEELAAVIAGDEGAIRVFVRRLTPSLLGAIGRYSNGRLRPEDQQDLLQDIVWEIFRDDSAILCRWTPAKGRSLERYLAVLAERRTIDRLRQHDRELPTDAEQLTAKADAAVPVPPPPPAPWLDEVLAAYRAECRGDDWVFLEQMLSDVPAKDAAKLFKMTAPAVHKRRQRVRDRLREIWKSLSKGKKDR